MVKTAGIVIGSAVASLVLLVVVKKFGPASVRALL
jgi:hypothetical protein